jgi:hypothetical protein
MIEKSSGWLEIWYGAIGVEGVSRGCVLGVQGKEVGTGEVVRGF